MSRHRLGEDDHTAQFPRLVTPETFPASDLTPATIEELAESERVDQARAEHPWRGVLRTRRPAVLAAALTGVLVIGFAGWAMAGPDAPSAPSSQPHSPPMGAAGYAESFGAVPTSAAPSASPIQGGMPKPVSPRPTGGSPSATVRPQEGFGLTALSLRSVSSADRYVAVDGSYGDLERVDSRSSRSARSNATFTVVAGLANASCFSLRDEEGRYLRHAGYRIRAHADDGSELFDKDATFCVRAGGTPGAVMLESHNYPGYYLHARGGELWIDKLQDSEAFRRECTFLPVAALD